MNEDTWEELKKFIKSELKSYTRVGIGNYSSLILPYHKVLNKMNELERGVGEAAAVTELDMDVRFNEHHERLSRVGKDPSDP